MFFKKFFSKFSGAPSGSAFGRLDGATTRLSEARGKLTAIQDSITVKNEETAKLKDAAFAAHSQHDALDSSIDELHEILG